MAAAKQAIRHTLLEAKADALHAADPRYWVPKYPLPSLAAGFAVGLGLLYPRSTEETTTEHRHYDSDGTGEFEEHTEKRKRSAGKTLISRLGSLARIGQKALKYAVVPI